MVHRRPARPTTRRIPGIPVAGMVVLVAATLVYQLLVSSSSTAAPPLTSWAPTEPLDLPDRAPRGALGEADGAVPDETTVFDDGVPGVAHLDADLLRAL